MGKSVKYFFNYSANEQSVPYVYKNGVELLSETRIDTQDTLDIPAWGVKIIEELYYND